MGEHHQASTPTALYGIVLLFSGAAYTILQRALIREQGPQSRLALAIGRDTKGLVSVAAYVIAIPSAFCHPGISQLLYLAVVLMWLVPDSRIEKELRHG
jgi:uncharacterized membrane protein